EESPEGEAQESRRQIRRQARARDESTAEKKPCSLFRKPLLTPCDGHGVEELSRPNALQQRPAKSTGEQIQQRVSNPDPQEHSKKSGLPRQAASSRQQRSAHSRHVFLHEGEQPKCQSLSVRHPIMKSKRKPCWKGAWHELCSRVRRPYCCLLAF